MNQDTDPEDMVEALPTSEHRVRHYYGDHVRRLFIAGAVCELAALPFFHDLVPVLPAFIVIIIALAVVLLAGLTAPKNRRVASINVAIAAILFVGFEYFAVDSYYSQNTLLSLIRQAIAIIYLVAVYYGVKTIRNMDAKVRL